MPPPTPSDRFGQAFRKNTRTRRAVAGAFPTPAPAPRPRCHPRFLLITRKKSTPPRRHIQRTIDTRNRKKKKKKKEKNTTTTNEEREKKNLPLSFRLLWIQKGKGKGKVEIRRTPVVGASHRRFRHRMHFPSRLPVRHHGVRVTSPLPPPRTCEWGVHPSSRPPPLFLLLLLHQKKKNKTNKTSTKRPGGAAILARTRICPPPLPSRWGSQKAKTPPLGSATPLATRPTTPTHLPPRAPPKKKIYLSMHPKRWERRRRRRNRRSLSGGDLPPHPFPIQP